MKTMNVKIPLDVAQKMSDNGHLNGEYIKELIIMKIEQELPAEELGGVPFNYSFKIPDNIHKLVKLKAIEKNLPMNDLIGRLIVRYY